MIYELDQRRTPHVIFLLKRMIKAIIRDPALVSHYIVKSPGSLPFKGACESPTCSELFCKKVQLVCKHLRDCEDKSKCRLYCEIMQWVAECKANESAKKKRQRDPQQSKSVKKRRKDGNKLQIQILSLMKYEIITPEEAKNLLTDYSKCAILAILIHRVECKGCPKKYYHDRVLRDYPNHLRECGLDKTGVPVVPGVPVVHGMPGVPYICSCDCTNSFCQVVKMIIEHFKNCPKVCKVLSKWINANHEVRAAAKVLASFESTT